MNEIITSFEDRNLTKSSSLIEKFLDEIAQSEITRQNLHCLLIDKIKTSVSYNEDPPQEIIPGWVLKLIFTIIFRSITKLCLPISVSISGHFKIFKITYSSDHSAIVHRKYATHQIFNERRFC